MTAGDDELDLLGDLPPARRLEVDELEDLCELYPPGKSAEHDFGFFRLLRWLETVPSPRRD